ncbi:MULTISPECIES: PTS lactose/cellobiose transporter subunit IIA [Virgibacillus]|uniref:Lichenan-specific phosphotransferase enzyme IIA component n=1 Tax=Virgibacillus dokdonensis TaxID=302167 RepID=A0A2K9J4V2_9BACI|nr:MULTISPECIES: PTS lactose/cellobiose transporter subunit IIA [Virgibacillus]AUJ24010.1 Lichenan-specific phosphotransferase enzyme IIA component [Virgibacillus dokdonensis]NWO12864.1 PTS lactose/cellobiose transporter subunit IIA [Virgibacillus sp.]
MTVKEELQKLSFTIILHAGNARSLSMEAIAKAKAYQFEQAHAKIEEAEEAFVEAHQMQTKLLQQEAEGAHTDLSVILIHAQDHLMTALTVKDLAIEMIALYEKLETIEEDQR